ncbi:MAG: hypothetical protein J6V44_15430 [Methanobrevibacter sp.]|nr:hypothetical protein [Methanobrevibacter sp.]MBO7694606.1 hypothetical protein [Methanobrevibacter sp.]
MKIWYPIKFSEFNSDNLQLYLLKCQADLGSFKLFLKSNYNDLRWKVVTNKLRDVASINLLRDINAGDIASQFINSLQCKYDANTGCCYYFVSEFVKCNGTTESLNFVIRLIEYGNDALTPMNWIRHSYLKFTDFVTKGFENNEY